MSTRRPINDFPRNEVGLVDRFLGTAYDVVKEVWEEIPNIRRVLALNAELEARLVDAIAQINERRNTALSDIATTKLAALAEIQSVWNETVREFRDLKADHLAQMEQIAADSIAELTAFHDQAMADIKEVTRIAKMWATHPKNEIVEDQLYSSKHYAETAAAIVSSMSPVNWHPELIGLDVTIPDNNNAWSAGPEVTLLDGMEVTVGEGSNWTII